MRGLNIQSATAAHAVGTLEGRLVVGVFHKTPDVTGVTAYRDAGKAAVAAHPDGVAFLTVAKDPGRPPDPATREVFASMMKGFEGPSLASAIVTVGGNPLGMSVVRAVVTGLLMLVRHNTPTRIFGGVGEAGAWMEAEGKARNVAFPGAVAVEQAVAALVAAIKP